MYPQNGLQLHVDFLSKPYAQLASKPVSGKLGGKESFHPLVASFNGNTSRDTFYTRVFEHELVVVNLVLLLRHLTHNLETPVRPK